MLRVRLIHWKAADALYFNYLKLGSMAKILRVHRTKEQARESYDKISRIYDYFTPFEKKYVKKALDLLGVQAGERVLEIGFGTGHSLKQIAESVGGMGKACGIDISPGMVEVSRRRLERAGLEERVELHCGDALHLPYEDDMFDAVFMGFALETFDTPEIPRVLEEIKRVLKPHGRLGVVSMSNENGESILLRLYRWAHERFPKYIDCRPIYVEESVREAGYEIEHRERVNLLGLPGEIILGFLP